MANPLDEIEAVQGQRGMAKLIRAFYEGCIEEGFAAHQALLLSSTYISAVVSSGMQAGKDDD